MTFDEFMAKALAAFPEASVELDKDHQLVVYTNLKYEDGTVVPFEDDVADALLAERAEDAMQAAFAREEQRLRDYDDGIIAADDH